MVVETPLNFLILSLYVAFLAVGSPKSINVDEIGTLAIISYTPVEGTSYWFVTKS